MYYFLIDKLPISFLTMVTCIYNFSASFLIRRVLCSFLLQSLSFCLSLLFIKQRGHIRQIGWFPADFVRLITPLTVNGSSNSSGKRYFVIIFLLSP